MQLTNKRIIVKPGRNFNANSGRFYSARRSSLSAHEPRSHRAKSVDDFAVCAVAGRDGARAVAGGQMVVAALPTSVARPWRDHARLLFPGFAGIGARLQKRPRQRWSRVVTNLHREPSRDGQALP